MDAISPTNTLLPAMLEYDAMEPEEARNALALVP